MQRIRKKKEQTREVEDAGVASLLLSSTVWVAVSTAEASLTHSRQHLDRRGRFELDFWLAA